MCQPAQNLIGFIRWMPEVNDNTVLTEELIEFWRREFENMQ